MWSRIYCTRENLVFMNFLMHIKPLGCHGPKIYSLHLCDAVKLGHKLQTASFPVFEVAGSKEEGIIINNP